MRPCCRFCRKLRAANGKVLVCGYIFVVAASSLDYFRKEYNRTLSHEMVYRTWGALGTSKDKQNNILQKAVTMYLSQEVGLELVENAGTVS